MGRKRVVGTQHQEDVAGKFGTEELDEQGQIIDDVEDETELPKGNSSIKVITSEPMYFLGTGHDRIRAGGKKERIFSKEVHGKNFKELAKQFIDTCNTQDGEKRPRIVSVEGL